MKKLFVNARQIVTCAGPGRARMGMEMSDAGVLTGAAVLVDGERIAAVGPQEELLRAHPSVEQVDCGGNILAPGLVDSHTHAIFGRARYEEQEMRAAGIGYMEIAQRGGGIHSSVRDLRARSEDELYALALPRLKKLASYGTTTVEVKSGYGLSTDDEIKSLRVIARLSKELPMRLVPTWLGAHEIPHEFRETAAKRSEYIKLCINEMLPIVVKEKLAKFADVFCEPGVFTPAETKELLTASRAAGLALKLHADELEPCGGAELAAELGATSADHLAAISEQGIRALAQSGAATPRGTTASLSVAGEVLHAQNWIRGATPGVTNATPTVATLLPGTMLFLGKAKQAPARALIEAGAAVALASDFNPGTSPTVNFPLILTLGISQLRMSAAEVLIASTVNGAAALGLAGETGQIAPGFSADLALFEGEDYREIPYWYGDRRCIGSWCRGVSLAKLTQCPTPPS